MRHVAVTVVLVAMAVGGCNPADPGTTRGLGDVTVDRALFAARDTLSQRGFPVETADPATGLIRSGPREATGPSPALGLLTTSTEGRQIATVRVYREEGQTMADAAVALQEKITPIARRMQAEQENYSGVPDRTPAEEAAGTTREQRVAWDTVGYLPEVEADLLDAIYRRLHPPGDRP